MHRAKKFILTPLKFAAAYDTIVWIAKTLSKAKILGLREKIAERWVYFFPSER